MNRIIFLLGTDHRYQRRDTSLTEAQHQLFEQLIVESCSTYQIKAITEEFSLEAIVIWEIAESVPQKIARYLNLIHKHCDPSEVIRSQLGIKKKNDISSNSQGEPIGLSEGDIKRQLQEGHRKREKYWLDQLIQLNVWPVLFVCGAVHVTPFIALLGQNNIKVELISGNWEAVI